MDALDTLQQMHVEAKAAFKKIAATNPTERGGLWAKLHPQLELHEQIEEQFVYDPVARDVGPIDPVLARWEREHETQVRDADALMGRIARLDPGSDGWLQAVNSLASTLDGHIRHEENDIWPRIRTGWSAERLAQAGRLVDAAKSAAEGGASTRDAIDGAMSTVE
jgi:hypothetical protein